MAYITVEIPDIKAKSIGSQTVTFEELDELMSDTYVSLIDFGPEGMSKEDFGAYKSRRNHG